MVIGELETLSHNPFHFRPLEIRLKKARTWGMSLANLFARYNSIDQITFWYCECDREITITLRPLIDYQSLWYQQTLVLCQLFYLILLLISLFFPDPTDLAAADDHACAPETADVVARTSILDGIKWSLWFTLIWQVNF